MRPTRVLVFDSHDVVTTGVAVLLGSQPGIDLRVGEIADLVLHEVDVVLYDVLGLLEGDGSDLDRLVKESDVAVLALTRDLRPDLADRALERGADGCVSLEAPAEELAAAVQAAAWGDLHGDGSADDVDFTVNPVPGLDDAGLSGRERDVLALIAAGHSNVEIAGQLYLSINSVKTYIRSAYRRIGVTSRTQAVVWALQHGLRSGTLRDDSTT